MVSAALTCIFLILIAICAPAQCLEAGTVIKRPDSEVQLASNSSRKQKTGNEIAPVKKEFERICGQTVIANSLSKKQLNELVIVSDQLLQQLSNIADPWAKVYIFRLKKCRDFFSFILESREIASQTGLKTGITNAFTLTLNICPKYYSGCHASGIVG